LCEILSEFLPVSSECGVLPTFAGQIPTAGIRVVFSAAGYDDGAVLGNVDHAAAPLA
jgi:hypothetical protein